MCGECIGTPVPGEIIREKTQTDVVQPDAESLPSGVFIEEMAGQLGNSNANEVTNSVPEQVSSGAIRRAFAEMGSYAELSVAISVGAVTVFLASALETTDERKERLKKDKEQGRGNPVFLYRGRNKAQSGVGHQERAGRKSGITKVKPPKKKKLG